MEKTIHKDLNGKLDQPLRILPINETDLYEIHTLTDDKAGELKWLVPITTLGHQDPLRPYRFRGHSVVQTPMGPRPMDFPIEASTVAEALNLWPRALEKALKETIQKFEELRRNSLLVRPS